MQTGCVVTLSRQGQQGIGGFGVMFMIAIVFRMADEVRIADLNSEPSVSRFLSPAIPKIYSTSSASSALTNGSNFFIGRLQSEC